MELKLMPYHVHAMFVVFLLKGCNAQFTVTTTSASIAENSAAGTAVVTLAATGGTGTITYTLVPASTNFTIDGAVLKVAAGTTILDFETQPTYTLTIQAVDSAGTPLTATGTLTVSLTDANDPPTFPSASYSVRLYHGNTAGTNVGNFTATDVDVIASNGIASYAIATGNDGTTFATTNAGVITVASGKTLNTLTQSAYILTYHAIDGGPTTATTTIYIAVCTSGSEPVSFGILGFIGTLLFQLTKYL